MAPPRTYEETIADDVIAWLEEHTEFSSWDVEVAKETRAAIIAIVSKLLKPSDMEVLFKQICEYADAKREWDDKENQKTGMVQRSMRLLSSERWLISFADAMRGKEA